MTDAAVADRIEGADTVTVASGRKLAYGRVSTRTQDTKLQRDAFRAAGIDISDRTVYFEDKASGKSTSSRPGLQACLAELEPGDTLHVWTLSRSFRSFRDYVNIVEDLMDRGVGFVCLTQPDLSTTGPTGQLLRRVIAAVAQYEREMLVEAVKAGLAATKKRVGRPPRLANPEVLDTVKELAEAGKSISSIARTTGVSRATLKRRRALWQPTTEP